MFVPGKLMVNVDSPKIIGLDWKMFCHSRTLDYFAATLVTLNFFVTLTTEISVIKSVFDAEVN